MTRKKKISLIAGTCLLTTALAVYALMCLAMVGSRPDKLWLHRCNSLEKLHEKAERYDGIEVDVCYRTDGTFDVTHDEPYSCGLTIEPYFAYLKEHPQMRMWLDVKNLREENQESMLRSLNALARNHSVAPSRLIVESRQWQLLEPFTWEGYSTSCYVDAPRPTQLSAEQRDSVVKALQGVADSRLVKALSFPGWWYGTLSRQIDRPNIDLLTWEHRTTQWEFFFYTRHVKDMLDNPQLKVILIKDKTSNE